MKNQANDKSTCATCRFFQFKASAEHAWGQCLNETMTKGQKIVLTMVEEVLKHPNPAALQNDIKLYGRIYYREDVMGCIYHEAWSVEKPDPLAPRVVVLNGVEVEHGIVEWAKQR